MGLPNWIEYQGRKPIAAQLEADIAAPPWPKRPALRI